MIGRPTNARIGAVSVVLLAWSGLLVGTADRALATTYTVGTTSDNTGSACSGGPCSLRQLIATAEATPNPPDTIKLPAGKYVLNTVIGALVINKSMTIVGAGANKTTIAMPVPTSRTSLGDRVFDIHAIAGELTPIVTIEGVTITGGTANTSNGAFGGDVLSTGYLNLIGDWITNGFACSGAGVTNYGGTMEIERTLISGNQAGCGGGDSGGIQNFGAPASGPTPDLPGHLLIENSTITGNNARLVGGVFSWNDPTNTVRIVSSTIAGNVVKAEGGGAPRGPGAGIADGNGSIEIQGSIVSDNVEVAAGVTTHTNCDGSAGIHSLGYNLESGTDCGFGSTGDLQGKKPDLGALRDNGGPTKTLALAANSPAINHIPAGHGRCPSTDQRGVHRPQGKKCDIGAYERARAPKTRITKLTVGSSSVIVRFSASGAVTGFQCELKPAAKHASFRSCRSPKAYHGLKPARYTFRVRAIGPGGKDKTPATKSFEIT